MPLVSCGMNPPTKVSPPTHSLFVDPDDPKGGRFSVVGKNGRCEVFIDRAGRPNLGFVANDEQEVAQAEEMMARMWRANRT